jgi:hypothetical protein
MFAYLLPKTITKDIDRRTFFWQGGGTKKEVPSYQMDQSL